MKRIELINADCFDYMTTIEGKSVDLLLSDPPYMIGASSSGNNKGQKAGGWADLMNSSIFYERWFREARRFLKDTGYIAVFCNWRSLPTYIKAFSDSSIKVHSCLVWDKKWIGPAGNNQFRPRYELVLIAGMSNAKIEDRSQPDIYEEKWMAGHMKKTPHPAEKPVGIMEFLINKLVPIENGLVVDLFMGSGTTGVACKNLGHNFIGVEADSEFHQVAKDRIKAA